MKIDIIGHCNVALGIILDILHSTQKNASITIVSACNLDFYDKTTNIPYALKDMEIQETTIEIWKPNNESIKLIASMDLERRMEIFNNISKYLKKKIMTMLYHHMLIYPTKLT